MTIGTNTARVSFNCDGVTKVFPVPIQAYLGSDFLVLLTNNATSLSTPLVLNGDYSMATSGTLTPTAWSLTTLAAAAYAAGNTLQVILNPAEVQQTQYVQGQQFPSPAVQANMDRNVQMAIRLSDLISRAIGAPDGDVSPLMQLPVAANRKLMNLGFDANGNIALNLQLLGSVLSTAALIPFLSLGLTAAEAAAGIVAGGAPGNLVNPQYAPGIIERYGSNTTPFVTSMTAAFQAAVNQARVGGGADVIVGTTGGVLLDGPIDMTTPSGVGATRYAVTVRGVRNLQAVTNNSPYYGTILLKHAATAAFDNTGAVGVNFENISIGTDAVTYPKIGFLLARNADASSAPNVRMRNVEMLGNFHIANVYNYGIEDDEYYGCQFWNFAQDFSNGANGNTGSKAMIFTSSNYLFGVTSSFTTILGNGANHNISTQDHKLFGGTYYSNRGSPNLSNVQITGVAGQFSCNAANFYVGQPIAVTGALTGSGSITGYGSPTVYFVSATNGTTTFTLQTAAGAALVTTAGTTTGLTFAAQSSDAIYLDGVLNFRMYAPWAFSAQTGVNPGRAFLYIDTAQSPSNVIKIDMLMLENQVPNQQNFGIFVGNEAVQNSSTLVVNGGGWSANIASMYNSSKSNYFGINWFNVSPQATPFTLINDGTITDAFADTTLFMGAGAGTISRNIMALSNPLGISVPGDGYVSLQDPNAGANAKVYNIRSTGGSLSITTATDGNINTSTVLVVTRAGTTPQLMEVGCNTKLDNTGAGDTLQVQPSAVTGALMASTAALTNAAGAGAGTLTNAPAAGNPTKWIKINDNGTIRAIPAW